MFRGILASAAALALALQSTPITPMAGLSDDAGVHVVELQSNRSINEDGFAEVEDRYELTTSLSAFTSRAVVGGPVGLHDGTRVYHVGYVMGKGGYATYRGVSYRVLTIAQHSSNYYGSMDGGAASGWRSESTWVTP